ncbi:MAG: YbaB/EbfC family nucleoid-associated protein [Candidatus Omnitrophica bacterium]|nr:YbaB/EbfC family nucleoid-associated protein [Candidatus Omnitrophota bacterium]
MFDKMKQLMEMKRQADQIKKELDSTDVEVTDVKGIKIIINGSQNFKSIEIDQALVANPDKKRLERDLLLSVNAAINRSQNIAAQKMKSLMPGLPGL